MPFMGPARGGLLLFVCSGQLQGGRNGEVLRQGEVSAGCPMLPLLPFSEVLSFRGFESCNK